MAQVRKFQDGGTAQARIPTNYKFKVDNTDFELDDDKLDGAFDSSFKELVRRGIAKNKDRDQWNERYQKLKAQAKNGTYNIDTQGEELGTMSYTGEASNADLGLTEDGAEASYTKAGAFFGGVDDDDKQMSLLNGMLGKSVGHMARTKFNADQIALDTKVAADKKLKEEGNKTFLESWGTDYSDIGFGIYGNEGDKDERLKKYWSEKTGQTQLFGQGMEKSLAYFNDERFNDPEFAKQWQEKYKIDPIAIRKEIEASGYKLDGSYAKNFSFDKSYNLRNAADMLFKNDLYTNRAAYDKYVKEKEAAKLAAAGGAPAGIGDPNATTPPAATPLKQSGKYWTDGNTTFKDKEGTQALQGNVDGLIWEGGKLGRNIYVPNYGEDEFAVEKENAGWVWDGKYVPQSVYEKNLEASGDQTLTQQYKGRREAIAKARTNFFTKDMVSLDKFNDANSNSNFAFHDLVNKNDGSAPKKAQDVTFLFPNVKNARVYKYLVEGSDRVGGKGLIRYRVVNPNSTFDGVIEESIGGEMYLRDKTGKKISIGIPNRNATPSESNFYFKRGPKQGALAQVLPAAPRENVRRSSLKEGGTITKAQMGAILNKVKSDPRAQGKSATPRYAKTGEMMTSGFESSTADKMQLIGLAADAASLGLSATGVGSVGAGVAGLAGTVASFGADVAKDGFQWSDAGSAAMGLGLDAMSFLPGIGMGSSAVKFSRGVKAMRGILQTAFVGAGLTTGVQALSKIDNPSEMTIEDWRHIANGLQAVMGGKRALLDHRIGATKNIEHTIKANGEVHKINAADAVRIKSETDIDAKTLLAKQAIHKSLLSRADRPDAKDMKLDDIKLDMKISKEWSPSLKKFQLRGEKSEIDLQSHSLGRNEVEGSGFFSRRAAENVNAEVTGNYGFLGSHFRARKSVPTPAGKAEPAAPNAPVAATPDAPVSTVKQLPQGPTMKALPEGRWSQAQRKVGAEPTEAPKRAIPMKPAARVIDKTPSGGVPKGQVVPAKKASTPTATTTSKTEEPKTLTKEWSGADVKSKKAPVTTKEVAPETTKKAHAAKEEKVRETGKALAARKASVDKDKKISSTISKLKTKAKTSPGSRSKKHADGGVIVPMFQNSGILSRISGPQQASGFPQIKPFQQGFVQGQEQPEYLTPSSSMLSKETQMFDQPFVGSGGLQALNPLSVKPRPKLMDMSRPVATPSTLSDLGENKLGDYTRQTNTEVGAKQLSPLTVGGNKLPNLAQNAITASELARAMVIRNNNKSINTKVDPFLVSNVVENPVQVRGDLLTKNSFDQQANDLVNAQSSTQTSDGMLNTARGLAINQQAGQLRTQGAVADQMALNNSRMQNLESTERYAMGRQNTANQNAQNLSQAAEATRQGNNAKQAAMLTPIDNFWKGENLRKMSKEAQNKSYANQLKYMDAKSAYQPELSKLESELTRIKTKLSTDPDNAELLAQEAEIIAKGDALTIEMQKLPLQMASDPNFQIRKNFGTFTTSKPATTTATVLKSGGNIVAEEMKEEGRNNREVSKQASNSNRTFANIFEKWISSATEQESKERMAALDNINDIIKLALT